VAINNKETNKHFKVRLNTGLYFFMVYDVVDVGSINSVVVIFDMKEFARFLQFTLIYNS
jgi:hypothetical protein